MPKPSHREQLVTSGLEVVRQRGFNGAGVREITRAAGAPLGSFSNHFSSKEEFGLEILDRYFSSISKVIEETLDDTTRPPLERLQAYFDAITNKLEEREWRHGCLIGNTSLESAEHSEIIRVRLTELFQQWLEPFTRCLQEARDTQQINLEIEPAEMADFLLASWQGAILRMKVERNSEPLQRFRRVMFSTIFRQPESTTATRTPTTATSTRSTAKGSKETNE